MSQKKFVLILFIVILSSLAFTSWLFSPKAIPLEIQGILWPEPKPLQAFTLVDQHQQPFHLKRLKDKWTFLFFGYTYCPDICPTAMIALKSVYERLQQEPEIASNTQIVFVSVDPQRDTPEQLAEYVAYFHQDFIGMTGTVEEIDKLAHQIGAGYIKEPVGANGEYQISHTGTVFLIDPQIRLYAGFPLPHLPETIVSQYILIRSL
ncbi:MAG: SCO family protein [Candidatus Parabeggiatoa sp. nov. 3]|nr:MAG: SCO family protein [Gammaproteobacteria bacterium]RKZ58699.1 MAG: SCO family protein [Gammaproteobacteria bacterium]RKZ83185.1 MAG: SCO family protein [Gammaproteobacteria bacterium]